MGQESKSTAVGIQTILRDVEAKMTKALESVVREFSTIRTGRANPALIEGVRVDYYGTPTPLKQLASIHAPEPKCLVVQPWDIGLIPEIEKALRKADLGLTPVNDGKVIRVPIPPLSTERREELIRVIHRLAEEGRVSIRTIRHAGKESIEKLFKEKAINEDEKFRGLEDLQRLTDRFHKKVDDLLAAKEAELRTV